MCLHWKPWIGIEADDTSNPQAQELYRTTRNAVTGDISDLTRLTSMTPEFSTHLNELCSTVYRQASGLSLREKEILALVTSSFIHCVH